MPKTPKIHVMHLKAQVDIPVDPSSQVSIDSARSIVANIVVHAKELGYVLEIIDYRLVRIPAPEPVQETAEPEPERATARDDLDLPDNLLPHGRRGVTP